MAKAAPINTIAPNQADVLQKFVKIREEVDATRKAGASQAQRTAASGFPPSSAVSAKPITAHAVPA